MVASDVPPQLVDVWKVLGALLAPLLAARYCMCDHRQCLVGTEGMKVMECELLHFDPNFHFHFRKKKGDSPPMILYIL